MDAERRQLPRETADLTLRTDGDNQRFAGYAAVFNSRTAIGNPLRWGFYEEIAPGAFSATVTDDDQRMLIDHDSYYVVSRVSAGTLRLSQDARGLAVESDLDTGLSYVQDLRTNLGNGNITGMSFGFRVRSDTWSTVQVETTDGQTVDAELRVITDAQVLEVSAVTFPAYEETEAGLRSLREARGRGRPEPTSPPQSLTTALRMRVLAARYRLPA
jgi:HK97 family phage prohead protease